ncbi:MAG: hypothetical protein QF491_14130, partial [Alphaproteobacteria bacterium]|nr:hypothetical protein [Alphaproteobacteria bacterium]
MEETRPASAEATKALATFAAETPCEAVPEVVRDRMKECFLDFIGNSSFAANHAESSPAFRAGVIALSEAEGPG